MDANDVKAFAIGVLDGLAAPALLMDRIFGGFSRPAVANPVEIVRSRTYTRQSEELRAVGRLAQQISQGQEGVVR